MRTAGRFSWVGWLCLCMVAALSAWPAVCRAQGELIRFEAQGPVYVRADSVEYDERAQTYRAKGQVEITRGALRLLADEVSLDAKTLVAEAVGQVRLTAPGQVLTGRRMLVQLQKGTGKVYQGRIFVVSAHYYITGREIEKTGKDTYRVFHGSFTTCDGKNPDWQIRAEELEVTIEGYGLAKHSTFRVKDWPVLYFPYLVFPAKFKRQSGLLAPQIGNSKRDGFMFSLPYFQTLGEDQDLTFTLNYMTRRGIDLGLEYRYHLEPGSKGMVMIDYLPRDWRGQELYQQGELAKPYSSRYWLRAKADQSLFRRTARLTLDLDWVSDQDWTREFSFGNSGFKLSDQRFIRWFGRGLEPATSLERKNQLNLQRNWANTSFNASLLYWDSLDGSKTTLQKLPYLSFNATRQPVGDTGLYFKMSSSYVYYWREDDSTGHIADLAPTISLPLNFADYLYLEPSFTYSPRFYKVTLDQDEDPNHRTTGLSQQWRAGFSASTYLYRIYDLGSAADPFKIKHGLRPYLNYTFQPKVDDDDTANLARRGQERVNRLSYGLKNAFTYKVMGTDPATGRARPVYREFLRLNFAHQFDYAAYRRDRENGRYWGEVTGRLELDPNDYLYLEADSAWDLYANRFTQINFRAVASDRRGDSLSLDYRQTHDSVHQITTRLKLALTKEWWLGYLNRKDLREEIDYEQTYELAYQGQCWGVKFMYTDSHFREQGYWVVFSLGGFGEIFGYGRMVQEGG